MTATERAGNFLGGSDLAAILGIDKFRTPLDVYLEKVGEAPEREETEAMQWGKTLETNIAEEWAKRQGERIRRRNKAVTHPFHKWMRGHVDRVLVGKPEGLEVKLSSASGWGEEGTDEIPAHYLPQVHGYMTMTGAQRWHVAALLWSFGPPRLKSYVVEKDDEMSGILIEAGQRFLTDHVKARVPPDPQTSAQASLLWRMATEGKVVRAEQHVIDIIGDLEHVKQDQKLLAERRDIIEVTLKSALEDAESLVDSEDKPLVTWKQQTSRKFDSKRFRDAHPELYAEFQKESTFRVLRVTKRGKEAANMEDASGNARDDIPAAG